MDTAALLAVAFGSVGAVFFGLSDFLGAKAAKRLGGTAVAYLVVFIAAATYLLAYLLFFRSHTVFDLHAVLYAVGSGAAFTIANVCFYKGLELGPVNLVSPLGSIYPLVTLLLLVGLFGAHLSARQVIGIVVVVAGAAVAAGFLERATKKQRMGKGPLLALVAALCWGIAFGLLAQAVQRIGWQFPSLVELWSNVLLFALTLPYLVRKQSAVPTQLIQGLRSGTVLLAGVLFEIAFLAVMSGIDRVGNLAATVVAVSSCYPVLTVFLALRHLKEEFRLLPLAGAFVAIAGMVILSLG